MPTSLLSANKVPKHDIDCLAYNVYYEARGESAKGKLAVALVTLNRVDNGNYPNSICKVVFQKKQFSWTSKISRAKINANEWKASKEAALEAYMNKDMYKKFKATHYHNLTVNPNWGLQKVAKIGNHIFYKLG